MCVSRSSTSSNCTCEIVVHQFQAIQTKLAGACYSKPVAWNRTQPSVVLGPISTIGCNEELFKRTSLSIRFDSMSVSLSLSLLYAHIGTCHDDGDERTLRFRHRWRRTHEALACGRVRTTRIIDALCESIPVPHSKQSNPIQSNPIAIQSNQSIQSIAINRDSRDHVRHGVQVRSPE